MPIRPQVPASVRYYLRAKLRPFTRPAFWGCLSVLSLIVLFIWEAWQHPESLFKNPENETPIADTTLSKEESAVAADIDSLPVLMQELAQADVSIAALKLNQQPQIQSFLDEFLKQQAADAEKISDDAQKATQQPTAPISAYDPLGVETQAPSDYSSPYIGGVSTMGNQAAPQNSSVSGSNLAGSTLPTPTATPVNPLQAALDRLGNNSPTNSVQTQTPIETPPAFTNSLGQPTQPNATAPGQVAQPSTPGSSALPGQVAQPGTPSSSALPGQVTGPASPYAGTTNYSNMPVQVAQPGSPYPSYQGYGVTPDTSNSGNYANNLPQTVPVPGTPAVQPVVPQVVPITPENYSVPTYQNPAPVNGVPNTGLSSLSTSQLQPSQLQTSPFSVGRPTSGR
ncbi:hypothetical protein [Microseira wollei]|uniref:Uncharacterized protein n=1 Tax=Microseira wollei NIES-4236 TaxID=2530354 RepID=A0AAV3X5P1_9CYAN|nr:hypothetical protein [Microseira wollei]GET35639.1 hypothetical protein MiSe_03810 [Microseira wollei NIES-4236]